MQIITTIINNTSRKNEDFKWSEIFGITLGIEGLSSKT